jgi:hypothetical protein
MIGRRRINILTENFDYASRKSTALKRFPPHHLETDGRKALITLYHYLLTLSSAICGRAASFADRSFLTRSNCVLSSASISLWSLAVG